MIGTRLLGRYRLDVELGQGGTGVVYRGHDTLLQRDVAVKLLSAERLGAQGRARLLNEARAAAALKHPNIVGVYDAGETDGLSFIIMELVEGASLFERRPPTLDATLAILGQVCDALAHAHSHGIVHRDLKLENVIVGPDGKATLTDFGLARSTATRVTVEGGIAGTVFYLPPEQILGQAVDGRADLYALGVMLYELTAGRVPFSGDDPLAVISQHLYAPVVPPSTYNPQIPPGLDRLVAQLMSKSAADRPASAAEVRQALDALKTPRTPAPQDARPTWTTASDVVGTSDDADTSALDRLARGRLVGREREMAEARGQWQRIAGGQAAPPVLLISGEPGVGKTPVVHEIIALAELSGGRALASACYDEDNVPYAPIVAWLRDALPCLGDAARQPALAGLAGLAPDLAEPFGEPGAAGIGVEPRVQQQRVFESMVALVATLAGGAGPSGTPLLLVIEDLQWADSGSLYLLRYLARRCRSAGLRVLLLLTYRPGEPGAACCLEEVLLDLGRERLAGEIKLGPYEREGTQQLLASMFQQEPAPEFLDAIYRATEGNLFYIEEICKGLIEDGQLYRAEGRWQWPAISGLQLPSSIRATIQARLARLPEPVQELLLLAAIIGREFDFATLRQAAEQPGGLPPGEEALIEALELAERAQLIQEARGRGSHDSETFVFSHALIPATLQESISGLRRRRLHRRVLAALEALGSEDYVTLAEHAEEAGDQGLARSYYRRAGDRGLALYANQEAENYLRRGLALAEDGAGRASLLASLGEALFRQGRYAEAGEAWQEALDLYRGAGDVDHTPRLYARAARAAWSWSGPPQSLAICRRGLAAMEDLAGNAPETPGMAALLHETARAYRFNGQSAAALPYCEQALDLARRLHLVEIQAETLATLGILDSEPAAVRQQALTQAVALAESAGLFFTAVRGHDNMSDFLRNLGDLRGARNHYQRARELAQRVGMQVWEYYYTFRAADASLDVGDFDAARTACAAMVHLEQHLTLAWPSNAWRPFLEARFARYEGRLAEAAETLAGLRAAAGEGDGAMRLGIACYLADVWLELGRMAEAEGALLGVLDVREPDMPLPRAWPQCLLSAVHAGQGRPDAAVRRFEEAYEAVAPRPTAGEEVLLVWTEARLAAAAGNWHEAEVAYGDAAARLTACGAAWDRARLLAEWAGLQIYAGHAADGTRELLNEARAAFDAMGCAYYAEQAAARLAGVVGA